MSLSASSWMTYPSSLPALAGARGLSSGLWPPRCPAHAPGEVSRRSSPGCRSLQDCGVSLLGALVSCKPSHREHQHLLPRHSGTSLRGPWHPAGHPPWEPRTSLPQSPVSSKPSRRGPWWTTFPGDGVSPGGPQRPSREPRRVPPRDPRVRHRIPPGDRCLSLRGRPASRLPEVPGIPSGGDRCVPLSGGASHPARLRSGAGAQPQTPPSPCPSPGGRRGQRCASS